MRPTSSLFRRSSNKAAALIIVLAFVVLLTGLAVAYLSRATTDRQLAQSSFHDTDADLLARSALDIIVGDFKQEIVNGSAAQIVGTTTIWVPKDTGSGAAANMVPQQSGNVAGVPNLIRRSVSPDTIRLPGVASLASAVSSAPSPSPAATPKPGDVTRERWNRHYLIPRLNTSNPPGDTTPVTSFAPPDWVLVTRNGPVAFSAWDNSLKDPKVSPSPSNLNYVVGRYAYAVYDEGGLLNMNVAGYPTGTTVTQSGRKGSLAYADLTALGSTDAYRLANPDAAGLYQEDRLVGWRNYATTQPSNNFPDSNFAANFQTDPARASAYFASIINNTSGFLSVSTPAPTSTPTPTPWNNRTDQMFAQRQELIGFQKAVGSTTSFSVNALQYLGTFSREINGPTFSPSTPTAINPNFLLTGVTTVPSGYKRFDGTTPVVGEPLVKTRFPLSRLAWITYKGPSAVVYAANPNDPVILALTGAGVSITTIQAGTAANIETCFGLVWDSRAYVAATATTNSQGQQWVYISPSTANTGGNFDPVSNPAGNPASDIKTLATVASEGREPDFFELLRAGILDASLGQSTSNGVTSGVTSSAADAQGANTFPDLHMSNKAFHVLSIGACIIDQADPDSVPTRIQFKPSAASVWWTAYGVESLPYITEIYPISGTSPANPNQWATYLLFQLWNPHIGAALPTSAPQVRLRLDGNIGIFSDGGNNLTWAAASNKQTFTVPPTGVPVTQMALTSGALGPGSTPVPLSTPGVAATGPGVGTATLPGFETLPPPSSGPSIANYVGLRLPDFALGVGSPSAPVLGLYFGTLSTQQFNATMECTVDGGTTWIPYNHFIGITDRNSTINGVTGSWINGATVPVRTAGSTTGLPSSSLDQFNATRLTDAPIPDCLMKADPRATRFGIFQFKQIPSSPTARITDPLWPTSNTNYPNGYGGTIADPAGPVEHAPLRFSGAGAAYYPATFSINGPTDARDNATTTYADNDSVIRPADAIYPDPTANTKGRGSWTPYYYDALNSTTSIVYRPIMLNRPFRNVAELGYAFRDLPWKTLDFFTDKSADAGLLDIFTINDGAPLFDTSTPPNIIGMAVPTTAAGKVNLSSTQAADLQSVLAGAILDELDSTNTVSNTGTGVTAAPVLAANIVNAVNPVANPSATPMQNTSELVTRAGLPQVIMPTPTPTTDAQPNQVVKSRREVVARAVPSIAQTRVWNLLIDVVAQTGHYKPDAISLDDFIVEGEKRYWLHVAIDRFEGTTSSGVSSSTVKVLGQQLEEVTE